MSTCCWPTGTRRRSSPPPTTRTRPPRSLADTYREVVVKVGANGALWQQGFITASAPAERNVDVVDTTGAGDAFAAGFLASWLLAMTPPRHFGAGHRRAARAVAHVGGRPA